MALFASVFETPLGWIGFAGSGRTVWRVTIGHRERPSAFSALQKRCGDERLTEKDWYPSLRRRFVDFAAGKPTSFAEIDVRFGTLTDFQRKVLLATRAIEYGETVSYGELAKRAGSPKAARAVGAVMASNQVPIIIPCHRVVGANGELTGFSAPRGTQLKRQLLDLEQTAVRSSTQS